MAGAAIAGQLAMTAGSGIVGAIGERLGRDAEKALGIDRKAEQVEQQRKLNEVQIEGTKDVMNYGNKLQREMWNYTNYENQRKHMEAAGLNPALMYGMSGGGGSTVGNASGASPTGGHASDEASGRSNSIQMQGLGLQLAKMQSEIKLNESIAKKNEADAVKTGGVDTEKTMQEVSLLFNQSEIASEQAWITKVDADFAYQYKKAIIDNVVAGKNLNLMQTDSLQEGIKMTAANIRKIDQELSNLKSQKNLTDEQIKAVRQGVAESLAKISLMSTQERENLANANETEMNNILLRDVTNHIGGSEMKVAGFAMPVITTILKSILSKK